MAGSVNKVILVGNVGADPESRRFDNGGMVVNLRVATSESWKDKRSGERQEKTEWHTVAVFNEATAGFVEQYVQKGDKVYVEGQLQTRKWTDNDNNDRYSTEVVVPAFGGKVELLTSRDGAGGGRDRDDDDRGSRGRGRGRDRDDDRGGDDRGSRGRSRSSRDDDRGGDDDRGSRGRGKASRDDDRGGDDGGGRRASRSARDDDRGGDDRGSSRRTTTNHLDDDIPF